MADKLRTSDPLDGISLVIGLKFSKSIVLHSGDIIWLDTKIRYERDNRTDNSEDKIA